MILGALELPDDGMIINISAIARFNTVATCRQHDIVLIKDFHDEFHAGRIQLHCHIADATLSLVLPFALVRKDPNTALAIWQPNSDESAEFVETKDILSAVEYCMYPDGTVGTLLPIEYA